MKPIDLKEAAELTLITKQNPWVLVKFSATWCEPCQLLEPVFDSFIQQHTTLQTVSVNVDLQPELTRNCSVRSVPTLLLFKQGVIASQLTGLQSEEQINNWLNQQIKPVNTEESPR